MENQNANGKYLVWVACIGAFATIVVALIQHCDSCNKPIPEPITKTQVEEQENESLNNNSQNKNVNDRSLEKKKNELYNSKSNNQPQPLFKNKADTLTFKGLVLLDVDDNNVPVEGATVLCDPCKGESQTATTDSFGSFALPRKLIRLNDENYKIVLSVKKGGLFRSDMKFEIGQFAKITLNKK